MLAASGAALGQAADGMTDQAGMDQTGADGGAGGDAASGTVVIVDGGGVDLDEDAEDDFDDEGDDDGIDGRSALNVCGGSADTFGAASGTGTLATIEDMSVSRATESATSQEVDIDEDDVLLGIALANNGADNVEWNTLRDVSLTSTRAITQDVATDLDREDVFSALALGLDAEASSLSALACVSDQRVSSRESVTLSRSVDLEEDDVLLAIALANSVDSDLNFNDIADIEEAERSALTRDVTTDVDREDTFLALALGAGGEDGGFD